MTSTGLGTRDTMVNNIHPFSNLIALLMWWGRQTMKQMYIIMNLY